MKWGSGFKYIAKLVGSCSVCSKTHFGFDFLKYDEILEFQQLNCPKAAHQPY